MKLLRTMAFTLLLTSFSQLCPVARPQQAAIDGTSADWKTGKSRQEARNIEDQRYNDVIAGLDKMHRSIYADYSTDRIACGNDYRTNASCLKAAADKRDRRLAQNDQLRAQANAFHANQLQDIYRFWDKTGALNGDVFASRGGGNPGNGDTIASGGGDNSGETPVGGDPGRTRAGTTGGGSNSNGNRGGGNPGGTPGGGSNPNGNRGGGNPGTPSVEPSNGTGQTCPADPDWVRSYKAQGADPPLRYKTGFYQGVARCLQDQCTIQNLAIAISVAAFPQARAMLAVAAVPSLIDVAVNPPGFSPNPDPYARGKDEGSRLCNWLLKLSLVGNVRAPIVGPGGKLSIPPGFNFYKAVKTIPEWLPKINPTGCNRNCGQATLNSIRVMVGQGLVPAPGTTRGMTDPQMEAELGSKFSGMPLTGPDMDTTLSRMPEGTLAVISGENPTYKGTPPPSGPITNWNNVPGHFFWGVKANGQFEYFDGQTGGPTRALPGNWVYRWTIPGNALNP